MADQLNLSPGWDREDVGWGDTTEDDAWWPSTKARVVLGSAGISVEVRTVNFIRPTFSEQEQYIGTITENLCILNGRVFEYVRGRLSIKPLERVLSHICLQRLILLAKLMEDRRLGVVIVQGKSRVAYLPPIPRMVEFYRIDLNRYDTTIGFDLGEHTMLTSMSVKRMGSVWVCTTFDMG